MNKFTERSKEFAVYRKCKRLIRKKGLRGICRGIFQAKNLAILLQNVPHTSISKDIKAKKKPVGNRFPTDQLSGVVIY